MPRKFLRRYLPHPRQLAREWYLRPLSAVLHDPALWAIHRKGVAKAAALGLFMALIPIPGHTVLAALAAIVLRVNLPITLVGVCFTNPLTMVPVFLVAYRVGAGMLGLEPQPVDIEPSLHWVAAELTRYWQPLLLGSLVMGVLLSGLGYLIVNFVWRAAINIKYRQRRRGR
jgi:uncharacterized protein (DUF2062 family)